MAQFMCGDRTQKSRHTCPILIVGRLDSIKENMLRTQLEYLSSNDFEGRGTGTRGESLAAGYIQAQMSLAGLKATHQEVIFYIFAYKAKFQHI